MKKYLTIFILFLLIGTTSAQEGYAFFGMENVTPDAVDAVIKEKSPEKISESERKLVTYRFEGKSLHVVSAKKNGKWETVSGTVYNDSSDGNLNPLQPFPTEEPASPEPGLWLLLFFFALVGAVPGWLSARLYSRETAVKPPPTEDLSSLTYAQIAAVVFLAMRPEECGELACHLGEEKTRQLQSVLENLEGVSRNLTHQAVRFFASEFELEPWEAARVWQERPDLAAGLFREWLW